MFIHAYNVYLYYIATTLWTRKKNFFVRSSDLSRMAAASIRFEIWGDRESGPRNFQFEPKKFQIFRINFSFSRQKFMTTFFNPQLKKIKKSFFPIKRRSSANFLIRKTFSNILSVQNTLYFFETRPRPPCDLSATP